MQVGNRKVTVKVADVQVARMDGVSKEAIASVFFTLISMRLNSLQSCTVLMIDYNLEASVASKTRSSTYKDTPIQLRS